MTKERLGGIEEKREGERRKGKRRRTQSIVEGLSISDALSFTVLLKQMFW